MNNAHQYLDAAASCIFVPRVRASENLKQEKKNNIVMSKEDERIA